MKLKTICKVQNDNHSVPMEEYFQLVSQAFIKNFKKIPSLVMTGHYLKDCYALIQFLYATLS